MPIPIDEAVALQAKAAVDKANTIRNRPGQYLMQSVLAGAYVGVAVVLMLMVSASFIKANSVATKLVQGSVFGIALTLVVFAGAELFTGVVMTMIQGLMARKVKVADLLLVWIAALAGNFVGSALFAVVVAASGIVNAGAPTHEVTVFFAALAGIMKTKAGLSGAELFWRAVLCNFLVCLGLWMAHRTSSDAAKLMCLWWALLAFIASGFEHSVANMTVFTLGIFTHADFGTMHNLIRNLTFTIPGNIVGGGLLVAAAYSYSVSGRRNPVILDVDRVPAENGQAPVLVNAGAPVPSVAATPKPPRPVRAKGPAPTADVTGTRRRATSPPPTSAATPASATDGRARR